MDSISITPPAVPVQSTFTTVVFPEALSNIFKERGVNFRTEDDIRADEDLSESPKRFLLLCSKDSQDSAKDLEGWVKQRRNEALVRVLQPPLNWAENESRDQIQERLDEAVRKHLPDAFAMSEQLAQANLKCIPFKVKDFQRPDKRKEPAIKAGENEYRKRVLTESERRDLFIDNGFGIGLVLGKYNHNRQVMDFETDEVYNAWLNTLPKDARQQVDKCGLVKSPNGYHLHYKSPSAVGKTVLAHRACGTRPLIEVLGTGYNILLPGSPLSCHPKELPYQILRPIVDVPQLDDSTYSEMMVCANRLSETPDANSFSPEDTSPPANTRHNDLRKSDDEILRALSYISADCDRSSWINIGMILHDAGYSQDDFEKWSCTAETKYDLSDIETQWKSFGRGEATERRVGLGTLFYWAMNNGFIHKDPGCFPVELLGPILCPAIKETHATVKAPLSITAWGFIAAASFIAQGHVDVSIDGRKLNTSIMVHAIAESGERKSRVDEIALKEIMSHQKKLEQMHRVKQSKYNREHDLWQTRRDRIMRNKKPSAEWIAEKEELEKLGDEPEPPVRPDLRHANTTFQGLFDSLRHGQPSQIIAHDEAGALYGGYAFAKEQQLHTISELCALIDRGSARKNTSSGGNLDICNKRLTIWLQLQPRVAVDIFRNRVFMEQGFLARSFLAFESKCHEKPYAAVDIEQNPALLHYSTRCEEILNKPLPLKPGTRNELQPKCLTLQDDSKTCWVAFHDELQRKVSTNELTGAARLFAKKGADLALRVAANLAFFHDPDVSELPLHWVKSGIALVRHSIMSWQLAEAALAGKQQQDESTLSDPAQKIFDWIRSAIPTGTFKRADILQKGPKQYRSKQVVEPALKELCAHGLVEQLHENAYKLKP